MTPTRTPPASLRLSTVLLAFPVAFAAYVLAQVVGMLLFGSVTLPGLGGIELPQEGVTASGLIGGVALGQLVLTGLALQWGRMSPVPLRDRLALRRPTLPLPLVLVVAAGTPFLGVVSTRIVSLFWSTPSPQLEWMAGTFAAFTGPAVVWVVLVVGILPGVGEEFLFRGYLQMRTVARLGAPLGILLPAALFALMHLDPQHMLVALVMGGWCGLAAWWTRSLWTAVACHAVNNTVAVVAGYVQGPDAFGPGVEDPWRMPPAYAIVTGLLFVAAVVTLLRTERPDPGPQLAPVADG